LEDESILTILLLVRVRGKRESGLTIIQRGFPTGTSFVPAGIRIFAKILQTDDISVILSKTEIRGIKDRLFSRETTKSR
jgi:hypothetical protein